MLQALLNYATNAVKFSESGIITLRALMQEEDADSVLIRIEVQDSGIGIEAEAVLTRHAFEQADNSLTRKYGGTGLGLAINRHLALLMGGDVGVNRWVAAGAGSTFWFGRLKKSKAQGKVDLSAMSAADLVELS